MKKFECILILVLALQSACSFGRKQAEPVVIDRVETITIKDPGAVEYVWEPPIVDVVKVPPGVDPEGVYYRPAHEEVVEIRQGRWKYEQPEDINREK